VSQTTGHHLETNPYDVQEASLTFKESAPEARPSSLLKGFLFMNNYCLFNNLAAMSFKVLLQ
jgi:hypothetical protein